MMLSGLAGPYFQEELQHSNDTLENVNLFVRDSDPCLMCQTLITIFNGFIFYFPFVQFRTVCDLINNHFFIFN